MLNPLLQKAIDGMRKNIMGLQNKITFCWIGVAPLLFGSDFTMARNKGPVEKPNIVVIIADDLGWADVGYNGARFYETPHIDKLAAEGMVFSRFYPSAANCAPSRASLLTGMYTPRHQVYIP